ncbi:MAG: Collagen triple helix repeat-containing protein [Bacteroidetes bacterium]|jgi:hypothetical protein|nr:Collagen triple helix repeat-containing protein [Bacteroidota bacterium]
MKTILRSVSLLFLLSFNTLIAQVPQGFNYQAVARDNSGLLLANQNIGIKLNILQGSAAGSIVYSESHSLTSNANGLINTSVGTGSVLQGTFSAITWSTGIYFMEISMDVSGGTSYVLMGTQQLMSTPYALYAETSGSSIPGPQGVQGLQGPQGDMGLQGIQGPQGDPGPAGTYTAGTNINISSGIIKTDINTVSYTFSSPVSSTLRNTLVKSTEYLTIPSSGLYMLIYNGNAVNQNAYATLTASAYDVEGRMGIINLTQNPNGYISGVHQYMYTQYSDNDATLGPIAKYSGLTQSIMVVAYCNSGDQVSIGGIVYSNGSPDPTGNWVMGPKRLEAIKLRD